MKDYVLGDRDASELERLGLQHEVWRAETDRLLDRCGIGPGDRVLDLGCGPGFLSLDLARRVGPRGSVVALERSALFTAHLRRRVRELGLDHVAVVEADLSDYAFHYASVDAVVCRWVLMFLPEPERVVAGAFRALRPGGALAIMEYHPFLDISMDPRWEAFDRLYRAVARLIVRFGGDPDVGGRVPGMMESAGFVEIEVEAVTRTDEPGSPLWKWIRATGANHGNLVEHGLVTREELAEYEAGMEAREARGGGRFTAPTVQAVVAKKP